jgi:hypothetical protein
MRDDDMVFEEVINMSTAMHDKYDIVFVDDASYIDDLKDILENFMIRKKVFLSSKNFSEDSLNYFDEIIKKPFLPSQIIAILENLNEVENKTEETLEEPKAIEVLDSAEIERIKVLLEDNDLELEPLKIEDGMDYETRKVEVITQHLEADGLEIVSEKEYVETLSKKAKKKKKRKSNKKKEKIFTFEETLIAAIEGMKVKKIIKLLKGADITIKIKFKDKK